MKPQKDINQTSLNNYLDHLLTISNEGKNNQQKPRKREENKIKEENKFKEENIIKEENTEFSNINNQNKIYPILNNKSEISKYIR